LKINAGALRDDEEHNRNVGSGKHKWVHSEEYNLDNISENKRNICKDISNL
jgi:hypothetical protein